MTSQFDADRVLEDWLAQGPSQLPERAIHETIGRLDSCPTAEALWASGESNE